jgi:hypothetical protein
MACTCGGLLMAALVLAVALFHTVALAGCATEGTTRILS